MIVFPGEFDGEVCDRIWKEGGCAFGSGLSADYEIDKELLLATLDEVGLKPIYTYISEGLDEAIKYLTGKENKWVKVPYSRGDFETLHYQNMKTFEGWFQLQESRIGERGFGENRTAASR